MAISCSMEQHLIFCFVSSTTTEKFIREMARKEEQKLRQQSHLVHMSRMRQRVKSAQLLLEGRALGSK